MIRTLTLLGLGALVAGSSFAQNTVHYREGQRVEPQDVARILARPPGIKTRSIRLLDDPAAANAGSGSAAALSNAGMLMAEVDTGGAAPQRYDTGGNGGGNGGNDSATSRAGNVADDAPSALSLPVRFEFDSADISPSARTQLDALAEGIKMLSPGQRIVVEGHTDAAGTHEYNQILSQRRAAAVKQYLVRVHHIDSRRLVDTGVGEQQPIEGADPLAAQNRRVQFRGG